MLALAKPMAPAGAPLAIAFRRGSARLGQAVKPQASRGCLVATLAVVTILLMLPTSGYEFVSGAPELFSSAEEGIVILPEWVVADRKPVARRLWCSFLGYFADASCLPETRLTGLHVWFLEATGVEYHAVAPFPIESAAYIFDGRLRWYRGRESWEWTGDAFTELDRVESEQPFRDAATLEEVTTAAGWVPHRVEDQSQEFLLGPYRVRYTRSSSGDDPTEFVIEEGPVTGTLYSRPEEWRYTWRSDWIPDLSLEGVVDGPW